MNKCVGEPRSLTQGSSVFEGLADPLLKTRVIEFFDPACQNDTQYNFSEHLVQLHQNTPDFLNEIILLKDADQYVFKDIHDFLDFVLGEKENASNGHSSGYYQRKY